MVVCHVTSGKTFFHSLLLLQVTGMEGNRVTKLLGVRVPIMSAGMGGVAYSALTAAVSEAGGFGTIGAGTLTPYELREEIIATKKLTQKPFGVDLLAAFSANYDEYLDEYVDICIELGVKAFITGLGVPGSVMKKCHQAGMVVGAVCGKLSHVKKAAAEGCDIVIVQGTEGGGHTGQLGLMAFLPQAVDAVGPKVPVIAAGGIFDGRGVAAAFALGAEGVWVGTRFLATHEAYTVKEFKEKMLTTDTDNGTVITKVYTGKTCRVIANDFTREWEQSGQKALPFLDQALFSIQHNANHVGFGPETTGVDPNKEFMPCGQCIGAIKEILPAKVVLDNLEREALKIIKTFNRSRL